MNLILTTMLILQRSETDEIFVWRGVTTVQGENQLIVVA